MTKPNCERCGLPVGNTSPNLCYNCQKQVEKENSNFNFNFPETDLSDEDFETLDGIEGK